MLLLVAEVSFGFLIHFCQRLNIFYLSSFLAGFAVLSYGETNFGSLVLGFSERKKSLVVVPWICTFEAVLLEEQ